MNNNREQVSPNEKEKQPKNISQGGLSSVFGYEISRKQEKQTPQAVEQPPPRSNDTEVNDDFFKRPEHISTGSYDRLQRHLPCCQRAEDFDRKELCIFGRVPLNWDFDADRARPLPSSDEGTYGGGGARPARGSEIQVNGAFTPHVSTRGNEARVLRNESHVNGASSSQVSTRSNKVQVLSYESYIDGASTPNASPKRVRLSMQKPSYLVNQSVKVIQKTEVNDDFYKRPEYCSSGSRSGCRHCEPQSGERDKKELSNFGRVPLNWDFDADRARPLPSSDEGTYGGGARPARGSEAQVLSNGSQQVNGASTPHVPTSGSEAQALSHESQASIPHVLTTTTRGNEVQVLSNESYVNGASTHHISPKGLRLHEHKSTHLMDRFVEVKRKKIGCFSWF